MVFVADCAGFAAPSMAGVSTSRGIKPLPQIWKLLGIPADYATARHLPLQREPRKLARIGRNPDGRVLRLTPRAASAWRRMQTAAAADGITLLPISGFRSVARQTLIIRRKLRAGEKISAVLRLVAAPGCSEHHTGRALDIGASGHLILEESFAYTREFRWLRKHAAEFGFRLSYPRDNRQGIAYEPWHWCWQRRNPGD